ncbi:unnamed protein product [Phytomonas sp. EM1]|nr:unnamed protein product [Phytomonas sp. EM1]|eukprot:CCW60284.1 unnamed protein product [Phytomonas sp. isolate EM1]
MTFKNHRNVVLGVAGVGVAAVGIAGFLLYSYTHRRSCPPSTPWFGSSGRKENRSASSSPEASAKNTVSPPPVALAPEDEVLPPEMREKAMRLLDMLKQKANLDFQEGRYEDALKGYQECIDVTYALGSRDVEGVKAGQVVRANAVMCYIRLKNFDDASLVASMMLEDKVFPLEGDLKVKVLYRRGLVAKALGNKEAALADFRAAIHFSPDKKNPAAEREIAMLS